MLTERQLRVLIRTVLQERKWHNPAYAKHQQARPRQTKASGNYPPEKVELFHSVVDYLDKHMNMTPDRKMEVWKNVYSMSSSTEYHLKSFMRQGQRGFHDVKQVVLPGYQ